MVRLEGKRRVERLIRDGKIHASQANIALADVLAGRDPLTAKVAPHIVVPRRVDTGESHEAFMARAFATAATRPGRRVAAGSPARSAGTQTLSELKRAAPAQILGT